VTEDWFLTELERVAQAGRRACDAVEAGIQELEDSRRAWLAGKPLVQIVDGFIAGRGTDARTGATDALHGYEHALAAMRVAIIRALVDGDGLSLTEVSRRVGIPRQAVARLYHQGST
jgi:hypothetical protein